MSGHKRRRSMSYCPDRQETLWLDVHGELDPAEGPAWRDHLARCPGCREERERLARTLELAREALPAPELSPERAGALRSAVIRRLREDRSEPWWRRLGGGGLPRPALALATACLVVAVGWFMTGEIRKPEPDRTALETGALGGTDQAEAREAEILANLEILEEMEVLRKVVKVVDHKDVVL
jgi:anti-sigma factor RsiW